LLYQNQNGIAGSFNPTNGILSLSGTASAEDYQTALRSVKYRNLNGSSFSSASEKTISFSVGESTLYNQKNGHFYEFVVSPSITWTDAKNEAEGKSYYGLQGYLTTITSASENAFITQKLKGFGWIGATDTEVQNTWNGSQDLKQERLCVPRVILRLRRILRSIYQNLISVCLAADS
jgi:hypothetical protein